MIGAAAATQFPYTTYQRTQRLGSPEATGKPRLGLRGEAANDPLFTGATAGDWQWFRDNLTLIIGFKSFLDQAGRIDNLVPDVMVFTYKDAYAIYDVALSGSSPNSTSHPQLIAEDATNEDLKIPYPGNDPLLWTQFAADISDPEWWALFATYYTDTKYDGWFDDVNYNTNALKKPSNNTTAWPFDATLGQWTKDTWERQFQLFLTYMRYVMWNRPTIHNTQPISTADLLTDVDIQRASRQSDLVQWEFGWTSSHIGGPTTFRTAMDLVTEYHDLGVHIVYCCTSSTLAQLERNMTGFLLANDGLDVVCDSTAFTLDPADPWSWYMTDYGTATGLAFEPVTDVWRRDFTGGNWGPTYGAAIAVQNWSGSNYVLTTAIPYRTPSETIGTANRTLADGVGVAVIPDYITDDTQNLMTTDTDQPISWVEA